MKGVYQHCAKKHLHRYAAEFEFRYNNRAANGVNDKGRAQTIIEGAKGRRLTYQGPSRLLKNYSDPADDSLSFQIRFSFVPTILQNKMGTLEFFSSLLVANFETNASTPQVVETTE